MELEEEQVSRREQTEKHSAARLPEVDFGHIRAVRENLAQHGISTRKLVLENGAGLSRIERISAGALNQLLRAAYRSPLFA